MQSMQVRATEVQDAATVQLEQLRARSRELRLRISDLQGREQQVRESRYQTQAGPDRAALDRQWLSVRHDLTAATIEFEGVSERITELRNQRTQAATEQAQRAASLVVPRTSEPPPVEARGLARAGIGLLVIFFTPLLLVLVYRLSTRKVAREPLGIDSSPRFQRMEQAIETIAMEVESIAEAQRFTTRILAERHPEPAAVTQATPLPKRDGTTAR